MSRAWVAALLLAGCGTAPRSIWIPQPPLFVEIDEVVRAELLRVVVYGDWSVHLEVVVANKSTQILRLKRENITMDYQGRVLPASEKLLAKSTLDVKPGDFWPREWIFRSGEYPIRGPASVSVTGLELVDPDSDRVTPVRGKLAFLIRVP